MGIFSHLEKRKVNVSFWVFPISQIRQNVHVWNEPQIPTLTVAAHCCNQRPGNPFLPSISVIAQMAVLSVWGCHKITASHVLRSFQAFGCPSSSDQRLECQTLPSLKFSPTNDRNFKIYSLKQSDVSNIGTDSSGLKNSCPLWFDEITSVESNSWSVNQINDSFWGLMISMLNFNATSLWPM